MSGTFRISAVQGALIHLLREALQREYSMSVNVESLGSKDFNEDDTLVLDPPAVRVRYLGGRFATTHDNKRLTYQVPHVFEILVFESSLQGKAEEREQTLILVDAILDQLAGARLQLEPDGGTSMPVTIESIELVITEQGPVDQLYSIRVSAEGFAQYSGVNA